MNRQRVREDTSASDTATYQRRVDEWVTACLGADGARDRTERTHRFLEEALELVQSCGCTDAEAHQMVDYTFCRPVGEERQEVGGVSVTLAALCNVLGIDMLAAAEAELAHVWTRVENVRLKHAGKPKNSPLPGPSIDTPAMDANELATLRALLSCPEIEDFDKGVPLESAHQIERWGEGHDANKKPEDWFWLVGYLTGKALRAAIEGDLIKAKHHTISSAGALRNWHRALSKSAVAGADA
ncbi:MAG: hypothetical protein ACREPQ_14285 [Rhodanobacter sp.]